jgi:hypothetical protein
MIFEKAASPKSGYCGVGRGVWLGRWIIGADGMSLS